MNILNTKNRFHLVIEFFLTFHLMTWIMLSFSPLHEILGHFEWVSNAWLASGYLVLSTSLFDNSKLPVTSSLSTIKLRHAFTSWSTFHWRNENNKQPNNGLSIKYLVSQQDRFRNLIKRSFWEKNVVHFLQALR